MASKKSLVIGLLAAQSLVGPLTLRDLSRRTPEQVRGPKLLWRLWGGTNLAGSAAYWLIGRKK